MLSMQLACLLKSGMSHSSARALDSVAVVQKLPSSVTMPVFRLLQRSLTAMHESLASTCDANLYMLRYLTTAGKAQRVRDQKQPCSNGLVEER